jgi:hypothetical protein
VDSRSAPQRIVGCHRANQRAKVCPHTRAAETLRLPPPDEPKTLAMPRHNRRRFYEDTRRAPAAPRAR